MPLTLRVIPGYQFFEGERLDTNKLNQLGRPTIELLGSITSAIIAPGTITGDKLAPNLISSLPEKPTPTGADLLMIEDIDTTSLKRITISDITTMGLRDLPIISDVKFADYSIVLREDGKRASVGDFLREAIIGQTLLDAASKIDAPNDMVWLWDANAVAGTNPNRRATVSHFVSSFTNTLIATTTPMPAGDTLDPISDEVLLRDASRTSPDQQVRVPLGKLLTQVAGTKAFANISASTKIEEVSITYWDETNSVIGTAPADIVTGDWIWFRSSDSGSGVLPWIPYYVRLLDGQTTQFRLFNTRAAALANDTTQLVTLTPSSIGRIFLHWDATPFRSAFNITAIITTTRPSDKPGYFRVFFETAMATANYVVQLTGSRYKDDDSGTSGTVCSINVAGAQANPTDTINPTATTFDVVCRSAQNHESTPDYLMITVFA